MGQGQGQGCPPEEEQQVLSGAHGKAEVDRTISCIPSVNSPPQELFLLWPFLNLGTSFLPCCPLLCSCPHPKMRAVSVGQLQGWGVDVMCPLQGCSPV